MREDYEKMKSDAQIQEYNFMEDIMNEFELGKVEQRLKKMT